MKKLLIFILLIFFAFLIYLCNIDKKVYYLALGDSLAFGEGPNGKKIKGYTDNISEYLKDKNKLEKFIHEFSEKEYRTTDLINDIRDNKYIVKNNKKISIQQALIKADLVTLSIGANDILSKINIEQAINYEQIYNYIDSLCLDLDKLLELIRSYCKEDIIIVGYYNPYPYLKSKEIDDVFSYLNDQYENLSKKYNINYIRIDDVFTEKFLPNKYSIHPSEEGYKVISCKIIETIDKTLLKP